MKKQGYYSSGEFARMAHVSLRTIRYYDKVNILKPSYLTDAGARFYTDEDFARLQQILLLKYLGFPLSDIREMTIAESDNHFMLDSLKIQLKLVRDRIEQMQLVEQAVQDTMTTIQENHSVDWSKMLDLIHLTEMEKSMKNQYQDASNISSRINLHSAYSRNSQGWFPWIYEQCDVHDEMDILEVGSGDGSFWKQNKEQLPHDLSVTVSDISAGMLSDARRNLGEADARFQFSKFDGEKIPYGKESFDLIIANHVLFYFHDLPKVCKKFAKLLKPGGKLIVSAYGSEHMKEITELVKGFDDRIVLSGDKLYEKFGKSNGQEILEPFFSNVEWRQYEDSLFVTDPDAIVSYVLSCHGNQGQYILDRYTEFRTYVNKKVDHGLRISKDAGIFVCKK